jgi:arginase family enzyme
MGKPATAGNTAGGALIDIIGVPLDGMGRARGQAGAPAALRAAGLQAVFGPDVIVEPDRTGRVPDLLLGLAGDLPAR